MSPGGDGPKARRSHPDHTSRSENEAGPHGSAVGHRGSRKFSQRPATARRPGRKNSEAANPGVSSVPGTLRESEDRVKADRKLMSAHGEEDGTRPLAQPEPVLPKIATVDWPIYRVAFLWIEAVSALMAAFGLGVTFERLRLLKQVVYLF